MLKAYVTKVMYSCNFKVQHSSITLRWDLPVFRPMDSLITVANVVNQSNQKKLVNSTSVYLLVCFTKIETGVDNNRKRTALQSLKKR